MSDIVLKIGGSLLGLPDIVDRVLALANQCGDDEVCVVVGGGEVADVVRDFDQRFGLTESMAHELAIQAMSLNARLFAAVHDRFVLVESMLPPRSDKNILRVIEPIQVLNKLQANAVRALPCSWSVTSDSIAAWIADQTGSSRLVLAKSTGLPTACDQIVDRVGYMTELANEGLVDDHFPEAAQNLAEIDWVNLRDTDPAIQSLW